MTNQPTLPAEQPLTDLEQLFIDQEPPGLFPSNQNSNFGALRKVITDELAMAVSTIDDLYNQLFIDTADDYIGKWENEMGVPKDTAGTKTIDKRRTILKSRRRLGAFTRTRRRLVVERFITDTFGVSAQFSSGGISLSGGIPLYSDGGSVSTLYNIVESGKSYTVYIKTGVDPDLAGLNRELTWMTPAGIDYSVQIVPDPFHP